MAEVLGTVASGVAIAQIAGAILSMSAKVKGLLEDVREIPDNFGIFARRMGNQGRSLEVTTTALRAGYLRKNGVPYSENTVVNEYYDYHKEPNGDEWFTVTTVVRDPKYLTMPFITSSDFKKQRDASGWDPAPCSSR